jgi:GNAT superfamily N-acetyltransferase
VDDLEIRLARADDIEQLVSLRRQFTYEGERGDERPEFEDECRSFLDSALSAQRWRVWVACVGTQLVSHVFVALIDKVPRPTHENRTIAYLTNAYTVPEYRNRGIGGRLLAVAREDAAKKGVELMMVWPSEESTDFYRDHGFNPERDPLIWKTPGSQP